MFVMAQHRMEPSVVQAQGTKGRKDKWAHAADVVGKAGVQIFPSKFNRKLQHKLGFKILISCGKKVCGEGRR